MLWHCARTAKGRDGCASEEIDPYSRRHVRMRVTARARLAAALSVAGVLALPVTSASASAPSALNHDAPAVRTAHAACGWAATPPVKYSHVIWIWFEDSTLAKVIGNSAAPTITSLAKTQCGYGTNWLDNVVDHAPYIPGVAGANCNSGKLTDVQPTGDTCIVSAGTSPAAHCTSTTCKQTLTIPSIFYQVQQAGGSWKEYAESMPSNCSVAGSTAGHYLARHNPPLFFNDLRIGGGNTCATNDIPFATTTCNGSSCTPATANNPLLSDLTNNTLPTFSFVTPNACDDMHDKCSPYTNKVVNGDQWLKAWLPSLIGSPAYQSGNTAIFVMWDEGTFGSPTPNVVVAPSVTPGKVVSAAINNIGALGSTEVMLGLGHLGCATGTQPGGACPNGSTANLRTLFNI
jgi:hypothetical protein